MKVQMFNCLKYEIGKVLSFLILILQLTTQKRAISNVDWLVLNIKYIISHFISLHVHN